MFLTRISHNSISELLETTNFDGVAEIRSVLRSFFRGLEELPQNSARNF